jgi:bacillithiol system protein YtxJ
LETEAQLQEAIMLSNSGPVILFKHSTRCSISAGAWRRMEEVDTEKYTIFWVNVITDRNISNAIAQRFGVRHESPQALLLQDGEVVWARSHYQVGQL